MHYITKIASLDFICLTGGEKFVPPGLLRTRMVTNFIPPLHMPIVTIKNGSQFRGPEIAAMQLSRRGLASTGLRAFPGPAALALSLWPSHARIQP